MRNLTQIFECQHLLKNWIKLSTCSTTSPVLAVASQAAPGNGGPFFIGELKDKH